MTGCYNTAANAFSRCKKHLKIGIFFFPPRNKVKRLFAPLVWTLAYFVILLHSCSFLYIAGNSCTHSDAAESQGKHEYFQYCRKGLTRWFNGATASSVTASAAALGGQEMYRGPHTWVQGPNPGDGALLWKDHPCPSALHALCTALELPAPFPGVKGQGPCG